MRWKLPTISRGRGSLRSSNWHIVCALLAMAILTTTPSFAQSPLEQPIQAAKPTPPSNLPVPKGGSAFAYVNELADLSRAGNPDATRELAHRTFQYNGISTEIADAFGLTDRIVQSETAYRKGMLAPIHEADIVHAINQLVDTVGAPTWVLTNQGQVHKLRMGLL